MKAIVFQNVSKSFAIGQHVTLKRKMADAWERLSGKANGTGETKANIIWALRDVSFEVEAGETLGLIGPNGSGKSTTLKLLAKITEPDSGLVQIHGVVVPLIEIGAGFHQDLTGRDNIYLNGSILGLKKAEIDARLDSIVEFAGIPKFLDTPLKKYSTGMAVRLGFSIAAHINPDVLLVDEVLSLGDARFQRKCITKIRETALSGKTVVLVSHNMATVRSLCKRCLMLYNGQVEASGESQNVVNAYLTNAFGRTSTDKTYRDVHTMTCSFLAVDCQDKAGRRITSVKHGEDLIIAIEYLLYSDLDNRQITITLHGADGMILFETNTHQAGKVLQLKTGRHRLRVCFPQIKLLPGVYSVSLALVDIENGAQSGYAPNVVDFEVLSDQPNSPVGVVSLSTRWEFENQVNVETSK
jgi:ABC-type polysaccharide/polyol phosphate transport system ATPase subunit